MAVFGNMNARLCNIEVRVGNIKAILYHPKVGIPKRDTTIAVNTKANLFTFIYIFFVHYQCVNEFLYMKIIIKLCINSFEYFKTFNCIAFKSVYKTLLTLELTIFNMIR